MSNREIEEEQAKLILWRKTMIVWASDDFEPVPPRCDEAEAFLLGSMMLDASCIDVARLIVQEKHFAASAHQALYRVLVDMWDASQRPIDMVLLRNELSRRGQLEQIGGVAYLVKLVENLADAKNAENYARTIRERAEQ